MPQYIKDRRHPKKRDERPAPSLFSRLGRVVWWILGTGVGTLASYWYFLPNVTVSQEEPLDPSTALSVPFVVTNISPYDLSAVYSSCTVNSLFSPYTENFVRNLLGPSTSLGSLEASGRGVVSCNTASGLHESEVDITIAVVFKPWWWPFKPRERFFRFTSAKNANGSMRWLERPGR